MGAPLGRPPFSWSRVRASRERPGMSPSLSVHTGTALGALRRDIDTPLHQQQAPSAFRSRSPACSAFPVAGIPKIRPASPPRHGKEDLCPSRRFPPVRRGPVSQAIHSCVQSSMARPAAAGSEGTKATVGSTSFGCCPPSRQEFLRAHPVAPSAPLLSMCRWASARWVAQGPQRAQESLLRLRRTGRGRTR